jgi:cyanophycin synthetase
MRLYLDDLARKESREFPGFNEILLELLPGLAKHHFCMEREGEFAERLREGADFGNIVEHVALELTKLACAPVYYGKTRGAGEPGTYDIIIEYKAEGGTKRLLRMATEIIESLILQTKGGEPFPLEKRLDEVRKFIASAGFGPTTSAITEAATRHGMPWKHVGEGSLIQLGYGKHRRLIQAAMTDQTSAVAVDIASDKELTKTLLRDAGIEVPRGVLAQSEAEAVERLEIVGATVVIKPYNMNQGKGVSLNLTTAEQVEQAYRIAKGHARKVVVERQFTGRDYRVLVINGKVAAASERVPAHVIGDGERTIAELVEAENRHPARGEGPERPLTKIAIDAVVMEFMKRRDLSMGHVPEAGQLVYLRECANLSTGGTAKDVTDLIHPQVAAMCERAARIIGLDICGIDLILNDIARPPGADNGVIEINAAPGLRRHVSPIEGRSRDVGAAIVDMLYPDGAIGRIPIISITGTNGKTTITRMVTHALSEKGMTVGMATTDGIYIGANPYRFSISWPRIFPKGAGQSNQKGVDFYNRLVDELKSAGIESFATLYHWDLPQTLQDKFGVWQSRETAKAFGDYAGYVAKNLSDCVRHFFTINEFKQVTETAYRGIELRLQGKTVRLHGAPGLTLEERPLNQMRHHAVLGHAMAVQAIRAMGRAGTKVGPAENLGHAVPIIDSPEHFKGEAVSDACSRTRSGFIDRLRP